MTDRAWRLFLLVVLVALLPVVWALVIDVADVVSAWAWVSPVPVLARRPS